MRKLGCGRAIPFQYWFLAVWLPQSANVHTETETDYFLLFLGRLYPSPWSLPPVGSGGFLCTDEKENQIFLIYREIQNGAVAKPYVTNGLLINGEIFANFLIY
jgi:hypothetical protein